ncbi:MAG: hypothetical protein ACLU62_07965 [Hydrogeniiclostridium sp.]
MAIRTTEEMLFHESSGGNTPERKDGLIPGLESTERRRERKN